MICQVQLNEFWSDIIINATEDSQAGDAEAEELLTTFGEFLEGLSELCLFVGKEPETVSEILDILTPEEASTLH